jgi:hypothetical protein
VRDRYKLTVGSIIYFTSETQGGHTATSVGVVQLIKVDTMSKEIKTEKNITGSGRTAAGSATVAGTGTAAFESDHIN